MKLIPDELLRAHEDGEVVFFCGAGVSQSAGLPSFGDLVQNVLTDLLPPPEKCPSEDAAALAWAAYCRGDYDDALELLESPTLGTFDSQVVRSRVRHHLSSPTTEAPDAHRALIRLADLDRGTGRLVTTNFDRLFETTYRSIRSAKGSTPELDPHVAPALPPAKPDAFQGFLYLHGRLDPERTDHDKNLVLTKSDYGSAYMLDGWARRFVVDLFRHYHVVFVGYSVGDPTMRYLVSAMAAVREEAPTLFRTAYSLASYSASGDGADTQRAELTWRSKGVQPILYDNYADLWESVQAWGDQHQGGLTAHKQTVVRLSQVRLAGKQDKRIDEMAWALRKPEVAKYFADRVGPNRPDPAWIAPLQEHDLLSCPEYRPDDPDSPRAPLASRQLSDAVPLDDTTAHLSQWIARCLEDRHTLQWALAQGGVLHTRLRQHIRWALEDPQSELPVALRRIWRVLASDDYAASLSRMNAASHSSLALCKGLGAEQHFASITLLHWLRPVPVFQMREPGFPGTNEEYDRDPSHWYTLDLALEGIDRKPAIAAVKRAAADWNGALATMADELTNLLKEAMDWFSEFETADTNHDLTYIHYRSISPHEQTEVARIWTELIGLCRDAHDALMESKQVDAAERLVDRWRSLRYSVFRRLALHAAIHPVMNTDLGLDLLLRDSHPTLWDPCAQRETLRFLRKRGADIQEPRLDALLREILRGPPRGPDVGMTNDEWGQLHHSEMRLRLQKLQESGAHLSEEVTATYEGLPEDSITRPRSGGSHPEEFGTFISFGRGGISGFEDPVSIEMLRKWSVAEFVQWAEKHEQEPRMRRTAWEDLLEQDGMAAARRLTEAGEQRCWPSTLWSKLLHTTGDRGNGDEHTVRKVGETLRKMPSEDLAGVSVQAARWLKGNRATLEANRRLQIWRKIWDASLSSDDAAETETAGLDLALNHVGGVLGEILFAELAADIPSVGAHQNPGLPPRLQEEFAIVGEGDSLSCRLARVSMATRLVELYRIDPEWTDGALLSRMGNESRECVVEIGLWEGYFAAKQCSEDLLAAFKNKLLGVLRDLGGLPVGTRARAVHHFIHLAVWDNRDFSRDEARSVFWTWDDTSLAKAAWVIADILRGADDRSDVLWKERIGPWFKHVWRGREQDKTPAVSAALCRIALAVDTTFPDAVEAIKGCLVPRLQDDTLQRISTKKLATKFPKATATLLDKIIDQGDDANSRETARKLLGEAMEAEPSLRERQEFVTLCALLETGPAAETD